MTKSPRIAADTKTSQNKSNDKPLSGIAMIAPRANKTESPGKNGATTNPVSANTIKNKTR
ncbi:hypothetical protein D3C72_2442510 [compost metagenome]